MGRSQRYRELELWIFGEPAPPSQLVIVFRDVTEQRRLSKELAYRATHDSSTGLANRVEFECRLHRARDAVRSGAPAC